MGKLIFLNAPQSRDTMTKAEVNAIFDREAMLYGDRDGIPAHKAEALFGEDAVMKTLDLKPILNYFGRFRDGEEPHFYLTREGAYRAATFRNLSILNPAR